MYVRSAGIISVDETSIDDQNDHKPFWDMTHRTIGENKMT